MRYLALAPVFALLVPLCFAGCGKEGADKGAEPAAGSTPAEAPRVKKADKDRGEARLTRGSVEWQAERVKATVRNGTLTVRASSMDMESKNVKRQELHLQVDAFTGPGEYTTGVSGSRFIGVGIDTQAAKAAGDDDEATQKVAAKSLSTADHVMLSGAKVTVTSASDTEVSGTFSWQPPAGMDKPAITNGTFRAPIGN